MDEKKPKQAKRRIMVEEEISDYVDKLIANAINKYDDSYVCDNPFERLLSFGELVDRLSIINFKLYKLKDDVMICQDDEGFKSWAAVEDVKLVEERARLKKCIDEKLIVVAQKICAGNKSGDFNPEVKKYGKKG